MTACSLVPKINFDTSQPTPPAVGTPAVPKLTQFALSAAFKAEQRRELQYLDIVLATPSLRLALDQTIALPIGSVTTLALPIASLPMAANAIPCARDQISTGCSATRRNLLDYHYVRNQNRTLKVTEVP